MSQIILGTSRATGAIYGWRLLERLGKQAVEIHLILTRSQGKTLFLETGRTAAEAKKLADFSYPLKDIASRLASGSCRMDAMVIPPGAIHTMSAIATGITSNLLVPAADVTSKESRRLILRVRESPFHLGHLRNMTTLAGDGRDYCSASFRLLQ